MSGDVDWMTAQEAAKYLRVTTRTLRRYVQQKLLTSYQLPTGGLRFKQADLDELLRKRNRD